MLSNTPKFYNHFELKQPAKVVNPKPVDCKPDYYAALYAVGEALV